MRAKTTYIDALGKKRYNTYFNNKYMHNIKHNILLIIEAWNVGRTAWDHNTNLKIITLQKSVLGKDLLGGGGHSLLPPPASMENTPSYRINEPFHGPLICGITW